MRNHDKKWSEERIGVLSKGLIITDTGEVIENAVYYTPEEYETRRKYFENREKSNNLSDKYKMYFKKFITSFNNLDDLEAKTISRLMYLATYTSYDNNILKFDNGKVMKKRDIYKVLNLASDTSRRLLIELISKGYLIETDKGYQISKSIIHKGSDDERKLEEHERYTRIFIQAMRKMYLSVTASQHKLLGYVFQMLPYVNIYHNILCHNPFEKDLGKLEAINMIEFCRLLGLDDSNITRFRKNSEKVLFEFMGIKQHFMCYILSAEDENKNQGMIIINPNILYNTNEVSRMETVGLFYKHDKDNREIKT